MDKFKYLISYIVIIGCYFLISCSNSNQTDNDKQHCEVVEKSVPEKLKEAQNIDEISDFINGTTWHYTENLSTSKIGGWLKVEFKDGQYITYYANPSDGQWTEGGRGKYNVSEGRYSNTGDKYYGISWNGKMKFDWLEIPCEMVMTIDNDGFQLNVSSNLMKGMNALTMGINEAAYYNATHNQVYSGKMDFGDYTWD